MNSYDTIINLDNELIKNCEILKETQLEFINLNLKNNNIFKAPELLEHPKNWILEYKENGGTENTPAYQSSRLQQLLELTANDSNLQNIIEIINSSKNPNIIWTIEQYYKTTNDSYFDRWNPFIFSISLSIICSKINNNACNEWINSHTSGWMLPYKNP